MPETKQPAIKASGLQPNVTGMATPGMPAANKHEASTGKGSKQKAAAPAKQKAAAPAKKKVTRKKAAPAAKKASPGKKTVSAEAASSPSSNPASTVSAPASRPGAKPALSRDARQRMIGEAAYLISLKRHAGVAGPDADWLYAETVIDLVFDSTD